MGSLKFSFFKVDTNLFGERILKKSLIFDGYECMKIGGYFFNVQPV